MDDWGGDPSAPLLGEAGHLAPGARALQHRCGTRCARRVASLSTRASGLRRRPLEDDIRRCLQDATASATQQHVEESLAGLNHALGAAAIHYADVEQSNARLFVR